MPAKSDSCQDASANVTPWVDPFVPCSQLTQSSSHLKNSHKSGQSYASGKVAASWTAASIFSRICARPNTQPSDTESGRLAFDLSSWAMSARSCNCSSQFRCFKACKNDKRNQLVPLSMGKPQHRQLYINVSQSHIPICPHNSTNSYSYLSTQFWISVLCTY